MRMIGIGLFGFLLAGIALLLSNMNILEQGQRYVREITQGPHLVFEHRVPASAQDAHSAVVLRGNPDHPVILSGLPAYQSVAFNMPVDARPTSGYLQIDATSQVLKGVEGVLRISIHNTRRGEMLLRSGETGRSLQIPLSPTDFAENQLVVSFSLQGIGPQSQCGSEDGFEAVVEIETTSAVFLTLDRPMVSLRDRVHAWGNIIRVAWPSWLKQDEQLRRLVLATKFKRRDLVTVFETTQVDQALSTIDLRAALPAFAKAAVPPETTGSFLQSAANLGVRRFHEQTLWRERYNLGGGTTRPMPAQLDLQMLLGHLIGNASWTLTVTLNNRLVFQGNVAGSQGRYQQRIALPADMQAATNTLDVTVATMVARESLCDQGPELVAEILPASQLIAGDASFTDPLSQVQAALQAAGLINVGMTGRVSAVDAEAISQMLDQIIPSESDFKPAGDAAHITVLAPGLPVPEMTSTSVAWRVTQDTTTQGLSVLKLAPGDVLLGTSPALLVTPNGFVFPEAKG
ncbi:hypothetical protein [Cognatishimia sp. MH4019]|uniref:hypothetical protein n=1 Tax=Cognatishimia sp. MH4019 TaxID=2854030 RepID=UPI001CD32C1E|nr:hypothetical protein [Cognatishimia sp. MH4019]